MDEIRDDMERLAQIADRVLAGEPIEGFQATAIERAFVLGHTRGAVDELFDSEADDVR